MTDRRQNHADITTTLEPISATCEGVMLGNGDDYRNRHKKKIMAIVRRVQTARPVASATCFFTPRLFRLA
jgi:hypothetical protein